MRGRHLGVRRVREPHAYRDVVPRIVAAAPDAVLVVVTDPPDPLADLTCALAGGRVAGAPLAEALDGDHRHGSLDDVRRRIERDVRFANITIIEGSGASHSASA